MKIPFELCERIMKEAGADRVSREAKERMSEIMMDYGLEISGRAIKLAKYAGRKTIKARDIKLAGDFVK